MDRIEIKWGDASKYDTEFEIRRSNRCIPITHGLKLEVRDYTYNSLLEEELLMSKFEINAKRLNKWWYSIYFKQKE